MSDSKSAGAQNLISQSQLNELRNLLVGLSSEEVARLQTLLRDPHEFAGEISPLLPSAIRKMIERGQISMDSVLPIIEDALHEGIKRNPKRLADILFPVMGPAIRKAVSEDIKRLIQTANAGLEQGFSPNRLLWRLQALFTGRSYTEILLSNTYIFHVSHVMLIHRQTGLLLHQVKSDKSVELESDMISSMLTAIREFVSDSFNRVETATLDQIQVGEMTILIEQGPYAILAAIVKGNVTADYRVTLIEAVEAIHFNHPADLEHFDGDTSVFYNTRKFLNTCLVSYRKSSKSSGPWTLIIILLILFSLLGWFAYQRHVVKKGIDRFVEQLDDLPGYHISHVRRQDGKFLIRGFVDYESPDFRDLETWSMADTSKIQFQFDPIFSLEPAMVLLRSKNRLKPDSNMQLRYSDGTLKIAGIARREWLEKYLPYWRDVEGVRNIDTSELKTQIDTDLSWIIPAIERHNFNFDMNIVSLDSLQQKRFDSLVDAALFLTKYNSQYGTKMAIFVQVYTSRSGNTEANIRKATERVESFVRKLRDAGLPDELLEGRVLFVDEPASHVKVRTVTFSVFNTSENK